MPLSYKKLLLFILTTILTLPVYAKPIIPNNNPWKLDVSAYLWALNMNGKVKIGGTEARVKQNFTDIMKQFQGGGMFWVTAKKQKFSLFFNGLYSYLENKEKTSTNTIKATDQFALVSAGASYTVFSKKTARVTSEDPSIFQIEPYAGVRFTLNDARLKIEDTASSFSSNENWALPFVGVKLRYIFNHAWQASIAGDVGATNLSSNTSYDILGLVAYNINQKFHLYAGYRYLYQNYKTGSGNDLFKWQMRLAGPVIGASMSF